MLFAPAGSQTLHALWESLQVNLVDEPRRSGGEADGLVNETINALAKIFVAERQTLGQRWLGGQQALRVFRTLAFGMIWIGFDECSWEVQGLGTSLDSIREDDLGTNLCN